MKIVPMTRNHLLDCSPNGEIPSGMVKGKSVIDDDGRAIGVCGGYITGGTFLAFLHAKDELRDHPFTLYKLCKTVSEMKHRTIYAHCDRTFEAAERFLLRFGFRRSDDDVFVKEG